MSSQHHSFSLGRFSFHSLAQRMDDGRFGASLSIRSGEGSSTTGRIVRFTRRFDTDAAAHAYAREQGLDWGADAGRNSGFSR